MKVSNRLLLPALLLTALHCSTAPAPETAVRAPVESADPSPTESADPSATEAAATEPADPSVAAAESPVPESADPSRTTCYFGPSTQTAADGTVRPGADLLVRRTVDPEASTITEETVRFDTRAGVAPRRYTVVYTVDGESFTLAESSGAFAGSGRFTAGEPWAWTAWTSSYRLPSGIAVESTRGLESGDDGRAVLTAERVAYGPDGSRALTLGEELPAIDDAECERRFAELPPAG